jgi:hypothetical protein
MDRVGFPVIVDMDQDPSFSSGFYAVYHVPRAISSTVLIERYMGPGNTVGSGDNRYIGSRSGPDSVTLKVVSSDKQESKKLLEEILNSAGQDILIANSLQ